MSIRVPTAKVKELVELLEERDLKICFKDEGYEVWWHTVNSAVCAAALAVFRLFSFGKYKKTWMDFTTIMGKNIYLNTPRTEFTMCKHSTFALLRHEVIHDFQRDKHGGLWFMFLYALVLPSVFTYRAKFEMEAYTQQMMVEFEEFGEIPDSMVDWIVGQFTSPNYFWMWPQERQVREAVEQRRSAILVGAYTGLWPYRPEAFMKKDDDLPQLSDEAS